MASDLYNGKLPGPWTPHRRGLLFVLARCVFYDFLGSGYKYLRRQNGMVRYFLTRKQAQEHADKINEDDW